MKVTQSCLTLCNSTDGSPPGSSVHGVLEARILEWVAIPFARRCSQPRDQTQVFCIAGSRFFTIWTTREAHSGWSVNASSSYCCCSVAKLCATLWDPVDCSMPGFPVFHHLPDFAQVHTHWIGDGIQPSPLSSSSPSAFNLSQHQGLFQWVSCSHQVASIFPKNIQCWFPLRLTGLISLLSKLSLEHHCIGEKLIAAWDEWLAQGHIVVKTEFEPKQYYNRARINQYVICSIHLYPIHKCSLIRTLSEGDGGIFKLTDDINVRQKPYPWSFAIAINYENEWIDYWNDLRWVNYSNSLSVRSISRNSCTDRWKPFLFSDWVVNSSVL